MSNKTYGYATCPFCGEQFIKTHPRQKVCKNSHYAPCPDCGQPVKITDNSYAVFLRNGPKRCKDCANAYIKKKAAQRSEEEKQAILDKRKRTNLERFGTEFAIQNKDVQHKQAITMMKKYNVSHPLQNPEVIAKMQQHNREKYGVDFVLQYPEFKESVKATVRKRYGVDNVSQLSDIKDKKTKTTQMHYGVNNPMQSEEVKKQYLQSMKERYGVAYPLQSDEIKETMKKNNLQNYGAEYVSQLDSCKERVRYTMLDKYGSVSALNCPEIRNKYLNTMQSRYGVNWPMESAEVKEKARLSMLAKHNVEYGRQTMHSLSLQIKDHAKIASYREFQEDPANYIQTHYSTSPTVHQICFDIGCTDTPVYDALIRNECQHLIQRRMSNMEYEVIEFIQSNHPDLEMIHNDRKQIAPYELDIYIPKYNLAIECNPTIPHNSTCPDPWGGIKDYKYHQRKSKLCIDKGIQLFHIFGYEWSNRQDVIKSMIQNLLGQTYRRLYARNCYTCEVSYDECKTFLETNHKQGNTSTAIRLGLRLKGSDELVAVMTFGKLKQSAGASKDFIGYELSRFCNKANTSVIGGASKLFKYFITNWPDIQNIVSFSDVAHTSGKLYRTLGFKQVRISDPGYVWVHLETDTYLSRVSCQKRNLPILFEDVSEEMILNHSEKEIMESHGYVRVYDSGVIRWEWRR